MVGGGAGPGAARQLEPAVRFFGHDTVAQFAPGAVMNGGHWLALRRVCRMVNDARPWLPGCPAIALTRRVFRYH